MRCQHGYLTLWSEQRKEENKSPAQIEKDRKGQAETEKERCAAAHYTNGHLLWCPGLRGD